MSTLKVDTILKRTGTGTITLGQSGDTINLPAGVLTSGFGKIAQVLQTTKTDTASISSSTFAQISGFSVSITPSATTSKILIMSQLNLGNNSTNLYVRLMRDTTSIFQSDAASSRPQAKGMDGGGVSRELAARAGRRRRRQASTGALRKLAEWRAARGGRRRARGMGAAGGGARPAQEARRPWRN